MGFFDNIGNVISSIAPAVATIAGGVGEFIPGMQPFATPLLAGGLAGLGQQSANNTNMTMANNATNASQAMAIQQEQYQTQMSNTSYQRGVADMTAAGINPMMAITNGGASTPAGASGDAKMATVGNTLGPLVNSAISAKQLMTDIKSKESGIELNKALGAKAVADAKTSGFSAQNINLRSQALTSQLQAIKDKADYDSATAKLDTKAATYDAYASRINREAGTAANVGSLFKLFGAKGSFMSPNPSKGIPGMGTLKDGTNFNLDTGEIP